VPLRIRQVIPVEVCAVEYTDEYGRVRAEFGFRAGDKVYKDPNGERWAEQIRQFTPDMARQVIRELDAKKVPIPSTDAVDVVAAGGVEMVPAAPEGSIGPAPAVPAPAPAPPDGSVDVVPQIGGRPGEGTPPTE
jgi:hypothetical protein